MRIIAFIEEPTVVETRPSSWENPNVDLQNFIRRVNAWCEKIEAFHGDGVAAHTPLDRSFLLLERSNGAASAFILINKDWSQNQEVPLMDGARGRRLVRLDPPEADREAKVAGEKVVLSAAEVVYLI